jgi:hypothetical protein
LQVLPGTEREIFATWKGGDNLERVRENPTMWVVITEFEEHFQDQVESSADT